MLEKNLTSTYGRVAHIAHHVQAVYYRDIKFSHDNPTRIETAANIGKFTTDMAKLGIPTFATEVVEEENCMGPSDIHPDVKAAAKEMFSSGRTSHGHEASAYYYSPFKDWDTHLLTGFNASSCILSTVQAPTWRENARLIVVSDCIDDYVISASGHWLGKDQALIAMEKAGAVISTAECVISGIENNTLEFLN